MVAQTGFIQLICVGLNSLFKFYANIKCRKNKLLKFIKSTTGVKQKQGIFTQL